MASDRKTERRARVKCTDDDLKRLKESLETYGDEQQQCYRVKEFKALLSRLEAAENAKRAHHPFDDCMCDACQVWRKAAGK